ncbi:hypothetical protein Tco_1348465 [Tanacetum coccineum]
MKKGRPLVEDPVNARVPSKRKRKANGVEEMANGEEVQVNGVDEMANGEEVQVNGVDEMANGEEYRADEDLVNIEVEFENVEVGRKYENIKVEFELIGVEVINKEQDDGVDLHEDSVDLQDDGVDLQDDGVELQDDGHNIQAAIAPSRVRTRRQSQRLVMRIWNRRPMATVNGKGTTPEKAFLIL